MILLVSGLEQCFSTGGPRPSGGPQRSFGGPKNCLVNLQIVVSCTIIIKFMKSHFILLYEHHEMTKLVNFSTIEGMTATKKFQEAFGGPSKYLY